MGPITDHLPGSRIQPDPWYMKHINSAPNGGIGEAPILTSGSTIIQQESTHVRLNVRALFMHPIQITMSNLHVNSVQHTCSKQGSQLSGSMSYLQANRLCLGL
jgi:hypothetical protein